MTEGEILTQGPPGLMPISESIDPSLDMIPGSQSFRERFNRGMGLALSFGPGAIRAWQGTPHTFSEYSNEAIGSGQGAQTYGYGHYVAGNKATGEHYQQTLAGQPQWMVNTESGQMSASQRLKLLDWANKLPGASWSTEDLAEYNGLKNLDALRGTGDLPGAVNMLRKQGYNSAADWTEQNQHRLSLMQPGHLLEVHVKPEEHELLDWDQQMQEQHPDIYKGLQDFYTEKYKRPDAIGPNRFQTGEDIYHDLSQRLGGDEQASKALHDMGIPGVKYLDQGSRNLPPGHSDITRNYVIFDQSNLKIQSRDGIPMTPVEGDPFATTR